MIVLLFLFPGPHQDNCEERELRVTALCEQVSLRISSIDGTPVPARMLSTASFLQDDHDHGVSLTGDAPVCLALHFW